MGTLSDAVVVVTGAGHGIGRYIALTFAAAGARVVAADIDQAAAEQTAADADGEVRAMRVDVAVAGDISALVSGTLAWGNRIDVVVNNAGIVHVDSLLEHSSPDWERVFAVNVHGPFALTREAGGVMVGQQPHAGLGRRGQFINISSPAALIGRPLLPAYGASKAAINHLTMSTAEALRDREVAATVLYPGNVREGMWRSVGAEIARVVGRPESEIEAEREFQDVQELADTALFIAATPGLDLTGMAVTDVRSWRGISEGLTT